MRVQVNLATRPFVELRPFFLRLRLLMAALAVAGFLIFLWAHFLSVKAEKQQAELDRLRDETIAAQQAKLRTEQRMRQPANAEVLDRAHFLNALFLRKSFSWTAVMMDLENVLPPGVQVTSIEPGVATDGSVTIRLRVGGDRDRAVQLVRNLERSRRFLQPRLGSESSQTREQAAQNGQRPAALPGTFGSPGTPGVPAAGVPGAPAAPGGVEFEILASYNPLPAGEPYTAGHGHTSLPDAAPAAHPQRAAETFASPAAAGLSPSANLRGGYPRNGVVLPPYSGPGSRAGQAGVQPPAGGPQ